MAYVEILKNYKSDIFDWEMLRSLFKALIKLLIEFVTVDNGCKNHLNNNDLTWVGYHFSNGKNGYTEFITV